jgi:hypothetical protein
VEDTSWVAENERRIGDSTVCVHHYVTGEMNRKRSKTSKEILPHYTGSIHFCSFPLSESYCFQVLLAYKPWLKSNPLSKKYGKTYRDQFLEFTLSPNCPLTILLVYERAKRRKLQEDKGVFKHEPTSNVDYNHDMEMEMEGFDGDEAGAINMMALFGSNVPDTWSLPRGYNYDSSKPSYPRNPKLWKTAKTFLTEALDDSGTSVPAVDIPTRKVDEEDVHYNSMDTTASQYVVMYKVFGKTQERMEWEAGD